VEVADTGSGMPPEVLARVFDPFFSTKPKGHGLGLSAVRGIIRSHRGALGVDSEEGAGTTFRILLPAGPAAPAASSALPAGAPDGAGRVILVIDDETYLLEIVCETLELRGHTCLPAQSGEAGIAMLLLQPRGIDLVLLDLSMPGLGGPKTFEKLLEIDPELPVVLSSGYGEEEVMAQFRQRRPAGFLHKPYLAKGLIQCLEAVPLRER
jgi:two-component system, cell cycle sensor histidine kinase and response regulator CckA